MKKVKLTICFFLVFLCLILTGELFQNYIANFTNQFIYFEASENDAGKRREICAAIEELARKNGIGVFAALKMTESSHSDSTTVYTDEETAETLRSVYGICAGQYDSIFSGSTKIKFANFSETAENRHIERYYFLGDAATVTAINDLLSKKFPVSLIHTENTNANHWLITCVWLMLGILVLLMTWFDIQFQKKENFVQISLGRARLHIIIKNVLIDSLALLGIYAVLYLIFNRYTYMGYKLGVTLSVFIGVIAVNAMLYFTLYRIDFKEVLYGANINASTVSNCYVLKALTMLVTVAALSSNIILIAWSGEPLTQYKTIEAFEDYSFLSLNMQPAAFIDEKDTLNPTTVHNWIFFNLLKENKVACSVIILSGDENYLFVNNAARVLDGIPEARDTGQNDEYRILIPSGCKNKEEVLSVSTDCLYATFGDAIKDVPHRSVSYHDNKNILYFASYDSTNIPLGFAQVENPVIMYCDFSSETLGKLADSNASFSGEFRDIMFMVNDEDVTKIADEYNLEEHGLYLTREKVTDKLGHYKTSLMRIVLLNTVISVFLLLLELAIVSTLVRLEYKAHATELAVKKILGYTIYNKCKTLFWLNIYAAAIGIVTVIIISLMFQYSLWYAVILTGGALLVFEWLIVAVNVIKLERTSVPKILKGGSL